MLRSTVLLLVPALIGPTLGAKDRGGSGARLSFEVRLQDYAGLNRGLIEMATGTAGRVFKRAGVELRWVDCTPGSLQMDSNCRAARSSLTRVLRILPRSMRAGMPHGGIEFGRAMLADDASRGTFADIYWDRVQGLAVGRARTVSLGLHTATTRLTEARILGYVFAHELGHLFGVHHGKSGVMSGPWSPAELGELLKGTLKFQRGEEERLRLRLIGAAIRAPCVSGVSSSCSQATVASPNRKTPR